MNFDLSEEQQILVDSVARFVREDSGVERFRKLREIERGWDPAMWERMGEYGWLAVPFPEEHGGVGARFVDLALVLEQHRLGEELRVDLARPGRLVAGPRVDVGHFLVVEVVVVEIPLDA